MRYRNLKFNRGFTVLFAVIVSSLVLALGLGIVAITMKEVRLSGTGRDSQLAFYAADSGLECAEYYDIAKSLFATSSESVLSGTIKCNNKNIQTLATASDLNGAITTFTMHMEYSGENPVSNKPCVEVSVNKFIDTVDGNKKKTSIDARGYNTCDTTNQRRLERGYRVEYESAW